MKKIPSFTINHLSLLPGVYVSRKDVTPSGDVLTTFDCRMTAPNREPALSIPALHAIEHLAATYLRNEPQWADKVVYWGPMGCCTGNYLILSGDLSAEDILPLMRDVFRYVSTYEGTVPGASPRDCGNYLLMNLPEARIVAARYLKTLEDPGCPTQYPD